MQSFQDLPGSYFEMGYALPLDRGWFSSYFAAVT
jgi:hypothetical protein